MRQVLRNCEQCSALHTEGGQVQRIVEVAWQVAEGESDEDALPIVSCV